MIEKQTIAHLNLNTWTILLWVIASIHDVNLLIFLGGWDWPEILDEWYMFYFVPQVDDGDGRLNYQEFEKMVQIAQKSQD